LKITIKRLVETQLFEDELKEANEQNSICFDQIKELEAQLFKETKAKNGNSFYSY
jgi:hypothetical protein